MKEILFSRICAGKLRIHPQSYNDEMCWVYQQPFWYMTDHNKYTRMVLFHIFYLGLQTD